MNKTFALIVEEDRATAAKFQNVLETAGFETEIVQHAPFISERLLKRPPWLVILDLDLLGFSGNLVLERIRNDDRLRHIKVVAITSSPQIAESLSVEPDLLLFKPVSIEQFSDLLERFQLKLKYQSTIPMLGEPWDRVTGVYNQLFFMNLLERSLQQSREINQSLFAVLTVNFDQNGIVKDHLEVRKWISALRAAAESLKITVRPTDTVARFDQDNFHILIDNIPDREIPRMIANRIRKNLREELAALGYKIQFSICVGALLCDGSYENIDEILQDTKTAQTLGKAQGEELIECYDRVMVAR